MYAADYVFTFTTFFIVARIMATGVPQCDPAEQSVSGKALRGHTYKTRRVQDPYECLVFCDSELTCQSYNYVKPGRVCELNNRTKEEKPEDFVQDENRFYMRKWTNRAACAAVGVEDPNKIPDDRITSSSYYLYYYPKMGRLHGSLGWCQKTNTITDDYIQVDMGAIRTVCAVATQGKKDGSFVKSYKLSFSVDEISWNVYQDQLIQKIFQANSDLNTIVQHTLNSPVQARYIRFFPVTFSQYPCMRIEVFAQ